VPHDSIIAASDALISAPGSLINRNHDLGAEIEECPAVPGGPSRRYGPPVEPVATICTARSTAVTPLKSGQSP
jgi:hypothetical protein